MKEKTGKLLLSKLSGVVLLCIVVNLLCSCVNNQKHETIRLTDYVNPFIGTGAHGHTFPGAVVPFGGVQLSPDTRINGWDACSGYHYSDSTMYGFSHTHLSGTGIGDLGDILFLPYTGEEPQDTIVSFSHEKEEASPGYYSVMLDDYNIKCELSATKHTGWHKYTYPKDSKAGVLIDIGHILRKDWPSEVLSGWVNVVDSVTIEGYHLTKGWAAYDPIWFRAEFDHPFEVKKIYTNTGEQNELSATGTDIKMLLSFNELNAPLEVKVSISSVDKSGSINNMREVCDINSFDDVVELAQLEWEKKLSKIHIETKDQEVFTNFYTAMYHAHIAPSLYSDIDGRYMGMDKHIYTAKSKEAYTTFSLWDTYRAWFPLMTIIQPDKAKNWIYDLYRASDEDLLLPKWPLRGNYTGTMVGYPIMAVFADGVTKGLIDSISNKLLEASIRSATWQPEWREKHLETRAKGVTNIAMMYKEEYGYVPADKQNKTVSWGLEMAYYDWCIGKFAEAIGARELANEWLPKGQYYRNYFDPSTHYMRARMSDGSWIPNFDPRFSSHGGGQYTEGNAYQWSPLVPHDIEGLKDLVGGEKEFASWLDSLFLTDSEVIGEDVSMDITGLIGQYAHGNEPGHHVPYMFNYAGRFDRTAEIVDYILYNFYLSNPEGIIGNEDCGQMSAWYVMSAMGIYQICPGKPIYDLGRPIIDKATIKIKDGVFTINVHNNSRDKKYIQRAVLNGRELVDHRFDHSSIIGGGKLDIFMGETPLIE